MKLKENPLKEMEKEKDNNSSQNEKNVVDKVKCFSSKSVLSIKLSKESQKPIIQEILVKNSFNDNKKIDNIINNRLLFSNNIQNNDKLANHEISKISNDVLLLKTSKENKDIKK